MVCSGSVWNSVLDFDATANSVLPYGLRLSGDISPAQITANQNDYNPAGLSTASVLRLNSDASRNITSLAGGTDGRVLTIMNVGSFPIVLKNDDGATGTAANRFALTGDLTLAAKQSAMLMYDSTASRWRQIANGTATGSGDNLGNHTAANIQLGSYWLSGDGGNEGIRVDSSGNVGIDTPPIAGTRLSMADSGGGVAEIATLINSSPASAGTGVGIVYQGPSSIKLGSVGAMWEDGTGNNSGLYFNTRNTSYSAKMYLSAAGNLGIGTVGVPKENLHIYSTGATGMGVNLATQGTGDQQVVLNLLTKSNGSDTLGDATSAGWQIWANADGSTAFGAIGGPNAFGIGFAHGAGWDPAAFQILSSGMVGIGTHANGNVPNTTLDVGGSFALSGEISPAQITADQNNYDPAAYDFETSVLRLTSNASRTISGIVDGVDGRVLTILNVGTNPIVLSNQNASSTATNRFAIGANITIGPDQGLSLIYDSTSQRWRSASLPFSAPTCSVYSYSFPAIASQPGSTLVSSPLIPIATDSCTATVSISGAGSPQFRTCSDASCATVVNDWGSAGQSISNAQYVQARLTTSAVNATDTATLSVGSTLGNFSVDTAVTYKLIFITSALYSGNLGGVSGADAKCASAATAAGLSGTYLAWIADSTDASAPATRFTQASVPYRRKDMTRVANNWTGLTSGTLLADLNLDENGNPSSISSGNYSGQKPFHSNVNANGTRVGTTACTDWTSTSGNGLVGDAKQSGSTWSNSTTQSCSTFATMHILCVQQ
jgi:hypothetical protein